MKESEYYPDLSDHKAQAFNHYAILFVLKIHLLSLKRKYHHVSVNAASSI